MMTETVINVERNPSSGQPKAGVTVTTTTANASQPSDGFGGIKVNFGYLRTLPGILKLVELLFGILCMALASPAFISGTHFFLFVSVTAFIATLLWTAAYVLGIREVLNLPINWILTELINTGIETILYFIAFIVQLTAWSPYYGTFRASNIAAGVFGLFNTLVYAAGTYFLFIEHRSGSLQ